MSAFEKVTLYGIPVVAKRKVNYGTIDAQLSRDIFIRSALVEGDWETKHKFYHQTVSYCGKLKSLSINHAVVTF